MYLTRHQDEGGARWAADGRYLARGFDLSTLLAVDAGVLADVLAAARTGEPASGVALAPIDGHQEVWAAGVTYLRSREARMVEAQTKDIYDKVYDAARAEVFFKSPGWRVRGDGETVRIRRDASWNVPEPELAIVINAAGTIVGYTAGNDMSSRDIEGENPLYLPQAKIYDGSAALGPGIVLAGESAQVELAVEMTIARDGAESYRGTTSTAQLKRPLGELAACLYAELDFPHGAVLMTGAGIVPPDEFTLAAGDVVSISVGGLTLTNTVAS